MIDCSNIEQFNMNSKKNYWLGKHGPMMEVIKNIV